MSERQEHWNKVYADKSPLEVSWYQQAPELSLSMIARSGIALDAPLIDVGGGASTLVDHLLAKGYRRPAVLDISGLALAHARQRLGAEARQVEWFEADVTAFEAPHPYALWHDRAVFHFLTEADDRRRYVAALERALSPTGQVIIAAFAIGGPEQCSGLDIVQYDAAKLSAELGAGFTLLEQASELHHTPAGGEQRFGYYRFARQS